MADEEIALPREIELLVKAQDVKGLAEMLDPERQSDLRRAAARALGAMGTPEALESLAPLMAKPEPFISEDLVEQVVQHKGEHVVRLLEAGLAADDPFWRSRLVRLASNRPEPGALRVLLRASRDGQSANRRLASAEIRRVLRDRPDQALPLPKETLAALFRILDRTGILPFLKRPEPAFRGGAVHRLGEIGGAEAGADLVQCLKTADEELLPNLLDALDGIPAVPTEPLVPLLEHPAPAIRCRVLRLYVRIVGQPGRPLAERMLKDPEPVVRIAAMQAILRLGGVNVVAQVEPLVTDPAVEVRRALAEGMLTCKAEGAEKILNLFLNDADPALGRTALVGLAARGIIDDNLRDRYILFLEDGSGGAILEGPILDALCGVVRSLSQTTPPEALGGMVAAARSSSPRLRREAMAALEKYPEEIRLTAYGMLADTDDKSVLRRIGISLGQTRRPEAIIPLIRILDEVGGSVTREAKKLLEPYEEISQVDFLINLLYYRRPSVRRYSAERLGILGAAEAVDPLLKLLEDKDVEVQLAAVTALGKFAGEERVAKPLIGFITYGDLSVRQIAIQTLGEAKVVAAVEPLTRVLGNIFLRAYAEPALKSIGDRKGILAIRRRKIRDMYLAQIKKQQAEAMARRMKRGPARPVPGAKAVVGMPRRLGAE